ncbi:hypothetical protein AVEN_156446-1 [Araneus ventricosus]|uniref:Uncharacterized protein n=1 Tax=Araneus ventricosus TaxID=182803 RepID=A0A4Y2JZ90_ARAVE|nr:hypothetical protein AVEN_156446-1 [Araneus ventricosus]
MEKFGQQLLLETRSYSLFGSAKRRKSAVSTPRARYNSDGQERCQWQRSSDYATRVPSTQQAKLRKPKQADAAARKSGVTKEAFRLQLSARLARRRKDACDNDPECAGTLNGKGSFITSLIQQERASRVTRV